MRFLIAAISLALLCLVKGADDDQTARLLASKNILNQLAVEGRDLTVEYSIYNIGGSAAHQVQLADETFPDGDFEVVHGSLNVKWQRLAPGSNVSHAVILRPLKYGYFNFTSATVSYLPTEEASEPIMGYTSAPGQGYILNFRDYDRKFSPHILDWGAFAVMTLPSLGIPFLLWYSSKSKYDSPKQKKN